MKQEVQLPTGELVEVTVEAEVTGEEIPPLDLQAEMATLLQAEIDSQSGNLSALVVVGVAATGGAADSVFGSWVIAIDSAY